MMATTKTDTTRGHWLEHHDHSSSLVATLTKTTVRGPSYMYRHGRGDVAATLLQLAINANLTHSCYDVHECMFQECHNFCAHCPVTFWWQSCECNCYLHAHALHSGSPSNVLHSTSISYLSNIIFMWVSSCISATGWPMHTLNLFCGKKLLWFPVSTCWRF